MAVLERLITVVAVLPLWFLPAATAQENPAEVDLLAGLPEGVPCSVEDELCDASLSLRQLRGEMRLAAADAEVEEDEPAEQQPAQHVAPTGPPTSAEEELMGAFLVNASCAATYHYCADYKVYDESRGSNGKEQCADDSLCVVREEGDKWFCEPEEKGCVQITPPDDDEDEEEEEAEEPLPDDVAQEVLDDIAENATMQAQWYTAGSCHGRCHRFDSFEDCQCTNDCKKFGNCCHDFNSVCRRPSYHGPVMTLYHTTSVWAAKSIVKGGFRPGHTGWCGGAVYFINHPYLPKSKYAKGITQSGAILEAKVSMGRMAHMGRRCKGWGGTGTRAAKRAGFQSLTFNPGDGSEFIIWNPKQVQSVRIWKYM